MPSAYAKAFLSVPFCYDLPDTGMGAEQGPCLHRRLQFDLSKLPRIRPHSCAERNLPKIPPRGPTVSGSKVHSRYAFAARDLKESILASSEPRSRPDQGTAAL